MCSVNIILIWSLLKKAWWQYDERAMVEWPIMTRLSQHCFYSWCMWYRSPSYQLPILYAERRNLITLGWRGRNHALIMLKHVYMPILRNCAYFGKLNLWLFLLATSKITAVCVNFIKNIAVNTLYPCAAGTTCSPSTFCHQHIRQAFWLVLGAGYLK